ncbi:hypothetical protein DXG01_010141 [Tephrocybe rancida]|nr:hypothetical protein DXG01_010141 [Tephrocybe rancida]
MPTIRNTSRQQVRGSSAAATLAPATRLPFIKGKRDNAPKPKPVILGEVIEISSDEDEPPPQVNSAVVDLRRQINKLKEQISQSKAELVASNNELLGAKEEISELRATSGSGKGKLVLDWFSTTLAQFMATCPNYQDIPDHNRRLWDAMMQNPLILRNPQAATYYAQIQQQFPRPQYTCPTCRERVKNRPVEDFALKGMIRTIAAAAGEGSPRKVEIPGRGKATTSSVGPWDGFFSRAT